MPQLGVIYWVLFYVVVFWAYFFVVVLLSFGKEMVVSVVRDKVKFSLYSW